MKKLKFIFPLLILSLTLASPIFAIDSTKTANLREKIETKTLARATKKEINKEKIKDHQETILEVMNTRYEYQKKLKSIIETKITEKETAGNDMTLAKTNIAEFDKHSISYLQNLNNFENKIGEILTSETPGQIIPELRIAIKAVRSDLNNMHKVLANTIKLIIKK